MEIEFFSCIAKINRDLLLYHLSLENKNIIFSLRSQGKLDKYPNAPLIFNWFYKWGKNNITHEITFEIWKDHHWKLRSEHNTKDFSDFENPLKGEFLYEYSFDDVKDMMDSVEKSKLEFFKNFKKILTL